MIDLQNARVNTAGVYVRIQGCYLFALGIRTHDGNIPVVRIGGHREGNETGWQCAKREAYEESNLQIQPRSPEVAWWADGDRIEAGLKRIPWGSGTAGECDPGLVVSYRRNGETLLSLMYYGEAEELPAPSSEVKGLLLLSSEEVHRLCRAPLTLEQYLQQGGKAILKAEFDTQLLLEPFTQLRLLSRILSMGAQAQQPA
jgi:8-oxo-dGTP pyrophosphatase MutT (NUDIX family)